MNHHATAVRTYPGVIPRNLELVVIKVATKLKHDASKRTMRSFANGLRFLCGFFGDFHVVRSPGRFAIYDNLGRIAASITQSTFHT